MDVLAEVGVTGHAMQDLVGDVLGMGGRKTNAEVRGNLGHQTQKFGKSNFTGFRIALWKRILARFPAVRIHILTQKSDLPVTVAP
jgi:hypothetical protein